VSINSRRTRQRIIRICTPDEIGTALDAANDKSRTALLLMLNCGFTQKNVSDLLDAEGAWYGCRIIRNRFKTIAFENVPTVSYKLCSDRVPLTDSGRTFLRKELRTDGRYYHADGITSTFFQLQKHLGLKRNLKELRVTFPSLLNSHREYGRLCGFFWAHIPRP
jgi:hypothetical protein